MEQMKKNNSFEEVLEIIKKADSIGVISHKNPDGDNIGSTLAMTLWIRENFNNEVFGIKVDEIPKFLNFLKTENIAEREIIELDLLIFVDCGDRYRSGEIGDLFREKAKKTLNIDHHKTNDLFADYNLVFPEKSSTCEIVYDFVKSCNLTISKDVANSLLTGINTDTNRFLYESSNSETLRAAADLYELGADKDYIYKNIYQSNNFEAEMLKIKLISRGKTYFNNQVGLISMFLSDFEDTELTMDMVEDVVNFYRDIEGFEVSIVLKEIEENYFKISLRSKSFVDVSKIALQLDGGGHTRASGCKFEGTFEDACDRVIELIGKEYFNGI